MACEPRCGHHSSSLTLLSKPVLVSLLNMIFSLHMHIHIHIHIRMHIHMDTHNQNLQLKLQHVEELRS